MGRNVPGRLAAGVAIALVAMSCSSVEQRPGSARTDLAPVEFDIERDADVPDLPFDDNPDPSQCGIPVQWGDNDNVAWLTGEWEGDLIQHEVLVYDSHLRVSITGSAPHGSQVSIILFQENPVLDYYYVRIPGEPAQEGWVPEPFLSFEPVA